MDLVSSELITLNSNYLDLYQFERVKNVSKINKESLVYDVSMPETHSFIANGIVNHNTTMARLIAHYINCENNSACGNCLSCKSGNSNPDIHELNMAETRGIDDVRSLIEKSKLAPQFNQRVFILDEIHQCFPENAEVLMADKSFKKISEVSIKDKVLSFNHKNEEVEVSSVTSIHKLKPNQDMVTVHLDCGYQKCTADHQWWSVTRQAYIKAEDLIEGEEILIIE